MSLITSLEELRALGIRTSASKNNKTSQTENTTGSGFSSILKKGLSGLSEDMDSIFEDAARTYGLSSKLLKAVAKAESNFNPNAVSKAGAVGVMQLMPGTAKSLGVTDSYDARQNIMGGAKYLKQNLDKFGDVSLALAAYNAGPNSVKKYGGIPPYKETQNYVKKIMGYLDGDAIQANKTVTTGTSKSTYAGNFGNGQSSKKSSSASYASSLSSIYASALSSLSGNSSFSGSLSSLNGSSSSVSGLNSLSGSNSFASGLSGLGSSASYANSLTSSLLSQASLSEDGSTVTMDKESFSNLVELVRMQMLLNAGKSVGDMSIL